MFKNIYKGKKVLITGNTGFKGSWLTTFLINLEATVVGVSKGIPTNPSMFEECELEKKITQYFINIKDFEKLKSVILKEKPDFIFHLAAQPIVSESYSDPLETLQTNVIGSANLLESIKSIDFNCNIIYITSDKCYENVEWIYGYKETDHLGGKDIYSASKASAENVFHAYFHSFLNKNKNISIATARAGNVIGGGDWAENRIIPDAIRSWNKFEKVVIRSPNATRPWQHVLEPISGYLTLGMKLATNRTTNGEKYNFGPQSEKNYTVLEMIQNLKSIYIESENDLISIENKNTFHEATLLKLNCDKALFNLNWNSTLGYDELIKFTANWYKANYNKKNMFDYTINQIETYIKLSKNKKLQWTE